MAFTAVIGVCVLTAAAALFIRQYRPDYSLAVTAAAGCVIMLVIIIGMSGLIDELRELFDSTGMDGTVFRIVLKSLGICYITSFAADLCKDFGQTSLAGKIELTGKATIVLLTMPLIKQILESALELIG